MSGMTAQQGDETRKRIVAFVESYIASNGYSPTVRRIAQGIGMSGPGPTHAQLKRLVREKRLVMRQVTEQTFVYDLPRDA